MHSLLGQVPEINLCTSLSYLKLASGQFLSFWTGSFEILAKTLPTTQQEDGYTRNVALIGKSTGSTAPLTFRVPLSVRSVGGEGNEGKNGTTL